MNKKIIFSIIIIFLIVTFLAYDFINSKDGFNIKISNRTNTQVQGLKITYNKISEDIEILVINPKELYKLNVNPKEDFGENTMKIYYNDKLGNKHEEVIIGYFERGYRGKILINVTSVDENGKITFEVKEEIKLPGF